VHGETGHAGHGADLAHVPPGDLLGVLGPERGGPAQHGGPLDMGGGGPLALGGGRGGRGGGHVVGGGQRDAAQHPAGGRLDHVDRLAGAGTPGAVGEEQIVPAGFVEQRHRDDLS
jgi:hypothetical protein